MYPAILWGAEIDAELSKSVRKRGCECDYVAPLCGRALPFRAKSRDIFSSTQPAGLACRRLSGTASPFTAPAEIFRQQNKARTLEMGPLRPRHALHGGENKDGKQYEKNWEGDRFRKERFGASK